jgi:hypothetical protein
MACAAGLIKTMGFLAIFLSFASQPYFCLNTDFFFAQAKHGEVSLHTLLNH